MTTINKNLKGDGQRRAVQNTQPNLQLLPLIMNNIPQAVFWKDRNLVYLGCNQAFAEDAGFLPEEIVGKTDFDMPWKDQAELYRADDCLVMEKGEPKLNYEEPQTTPDGSTIWLRTSKIPIQEAGKIVAVLGMYEDITEYKKAQEATVGERQRFQTILESIRIPTIISRLSDGQVLYANQAIAQISQVNLDKLIGFKTGNFYANPDDQEKIRAALRTSGHIDDFEVKFRRTDGTTYWALLSSRIVKYEGETCVLSSYMDITGRKQVEEDLLLRDRALASSPSAVFIVNLDFKPLYANQAFLRLTGYTYEEAMQLAVPNITGHPEGVKRIDAAMQAQGFFVGEEPVRRKDGSIFPTSFSTSLIADAEGKPVAIQSNFFDISERKQAEEAIHESEERFRRFTEATNEGLVFHERGKITDANPAGLAMFGLTEASDFIGRNLLEFVLPDFHQLILQKMQQDDVPPYEVECVRSDHSTFPVETTTRTYKHSDRTIRATSIRDITERKQAEDALKAHDAFSQKQSSVFAELTRSKALYSGDVQAAFAEVTEAAAMTLNVQRASIWYYNQAHTEIRCMDLFEQGKGHSEGIVLTKADFPAYFKALEGEKVIAADNAHIDPATQEFSASYLTPLGINSMLDAPIRLRGDVIGVICNEHVGPARRWTMEEQNFAGTIVDFVTVAIETQERQRLEQEIQTAFEHRGLQVQLSTRVAQSLATASSLAELYERVVTQVKEQFGYYHTQILRYDAAQETVVLVTGYGEIGAKMLADGHRMPMGEGLIGSAAATGETVLRSVLENDPDWHPNPLLPETKGEIAVPIKLGDSILGVLDVQSNVAGALGADDQLLLEGLCGQIATAIESTRLRQEMEERLEEINRLYRAVSHEGWQAYRNTAGLPPSFMFDQKGLRPVEDTRLAEELFANIPLAVPGGEVIGTLSIADDPQRPLSPEDESFLQQVSEQVALALESARLFEQTQSALSEVERRASELETVAKVSATTSSVLDPDQLLQSVVDLAKERFGLYHAHIYTYDESWKTLLLAAGAGEVGRKLVAEQHAIPMSLEHSLVARAARERTAVIVNDVNSEPGFLPNPLLPETCAEMAVPMTVGDKLLGVFDVQSNNSTGFSAEDANIYVTLAAQVGVALQNARLYVEQAALVTQLRELDKLKSSFLANMSHELRTPLNSILGFADVIIEELDGPLTENMSNDLRLIQKNGQHLLHLINDVLDMSKIEAGRMNLNPETFKALEVLEEVTSITSTLASEKNLALFIEPDSDEKVSIYADRTRLRQVMINLVNNSIKFTETGSISLKLASLPGARILITVKDTGIGIPADKLEPIFEEFTQVDASSTRKAGGTGLGLPISRRLVEMHGGRVWAESTGIPGEGSTFFVELPLEARITEVVEKQAK